MEERIHFDLYATSDWIVGRTLHAVCIYENMVVFEFDERCLIQVLEKFCIGGQLGWSEGQLMEGIVRTGSMIGLAASSVETNEERAFTVAFEGSEDLIVEGTDSGSEWIQVLRPGEMVVGI